MSKLEWLNIDYGEMNLGNFSSSRSPQVYDSSFVKVSDEINLSFKGLKILKSSQISEKCLIFYEAPAIKSVSLEFQRSRSSILLFFLLIFSTFKSRSSALLKLIK